MDLEVSPGASFSVLDTAMEDGENVGHFSKPQIGRSITKKIMIFCGKMEFEQLMSRGEAARTCFPGTSGMLVEARLHGINVIIGRQGESCDSACKSNGQLCVLNKLLVLNQCDIIKKYMSCKGTCMPSIGADQPAEVADDAPKHLVMVFTDISLQTVIEFNDYCHSHQPPISFIKAEVTGLFGSVFCDFGPEFAVYDVDGEEPHKGIIASFSNDNSNLVACVDDERLEFQDGDLVLFSEVQGKTVFNDGKPRKIKNARPHSFTLEEDTTNFGVYVKGGIVT